MRAHFQKCWTVQQMALVEGAWRASHSRSANSCFQCIYWTMWCGFFNMTAPIWTAGYCTLWHTKIWDLTFVSIILPLIINICFLFCNVLYELFTYHDKRANTNVVITCCINRRIFYKTLGLYIKDDLDSGVCDQHGPEESCVSCTIIFLGIKPCIITKMKKFPDEIQHSYVQEKIIHGMWHYRTSVSASSRGPFLQ